MPLTTAELVPAAAEAKIAGVPLVPWPRLWPFLKAILSGNTQGGLDVASLVRRVSRGEVIRRLPRKRRLRWAPQATVLVDYAERTTPFHDDFTALCTQLRPLRGPLGLSLLKTFEAPGGRCKRWGVRGAPAEDWIMPPAGTPVVILSDLGLLDGETSSTRERWLEFGRRMRVQRLRPLALAPLGLDRLDAAFTTVFDIVCWSPDTRLSPRRVPVAEAVPVDDLLALLSPAVRIEPPLLRAATRLLAPVCLLEGLEATFWQSPDLERTREGCAIVPAALERHRQRFSRRPDEQQVELLRLLLLHDAHLNPAPLHEEVLTWASLVDPALHAGFAPRSMTPQASC